VVARSSLEGARHLPSVGLISNDVRDVTIAQSQLGSMRQLRSTRGLDSSARRPFSDLRHREQDISLEGTDTRTDSNVEGAYSRCDAASRHEQRCGGRTTGVWYLSERVQCPGCRVLRCRWCHVRDDHGWARRSRGSAGLQCRAGHLHDRMRGGWVCPNIVSAAESGRHPCRAVMRG